MTRLLDLGIEPYLVASSVVGVMAQRLVRMVCKHCGVRHNPDPKSLTDVGITEEMANKGTFRRGRGCPHCLNSGYLDRTAIYEIFTVSDLVREQIINRSSATVIKQEAIKKGMRTLRMDGARKVCSGETTPEEVLRVTQMDAF